MSETNDPLAILPIILVAFPLAFGLMWFMILNILSRVAGWHRLAQTYPDQKIPEKYSEFMGSGRMGFSNYNGVLKLHADTRGLHLAMILPFRPGHAPVCVPWHAIQVGADAGWLVKMPQLEIQHQGRNIGKIQLREAIVERLQIKSHTGM